MLRLAFITAVLLSCLAHTHAQEATTKKPEPKKTTSKGTGKSQTSSSKPKKPTASSSGTKKPATPPTKAASSESTPKKEPDPDATAKKPASGTSPDKTPDDSGTEGPTSGGAKKPAAVSSLSPEELEGFESYSPELQQIIRRSLELTTQNLRYQFGSADPKAGGMDCSGTIYRVLQDSGFKEVPRQSDEICRWVMRRTALFRTEDTSTLKDKSLSALKPGDLLFWSGTYQTSTPRELPISHVMLYLGKRKKDGKPVVFGASDGRSYDGQRRNGVSVFDFVMPRRDGQASFYGYGRIPGLKLDSASAPASS